MVDLDARTLDTLDWRAVLTRLAHHARTSRGSEAAARVDLVDTREAAMARYDAVSEVLGLEQEERVPVGAVSDIREPVQRAGQGRPLEAQELIAVGMSLRALEDLRTWLAERADDAPTLYALAAPISIDPELLGRLIESFDERGELSEVTYPELRELRRGIRTLSERIQSTLRSMLKDESLAGVLRDRYVTQRGDRYVLPIKAEAKRAGLGIVHDSSGSGETVFIEPAAVVEMNNELRLLEARLDREIARILIALSRLVGRFAEPIEQSLRCAVQVDLACARADLGRELRAYRPVIGHGGVIRLRQARHPVLLMRGVDVVPNDLTLDDTAQGLILSGPNTGGKTVALKTLGLAALMCRAGIPVPATEGSRVDVFQDVIADIGDLQTVEGDLSTFSGHVLVLQELTRRAAPGVLVLLDEIAVGTDPAQGAALARAVLERLVDVGARLAVTTHYNDLKAFAATDTRFVNAAVHLENGQPSYRVERDSVGLSHAFSTARRLGLDPSLVDRAEGLLSEEARAVGGLLEQLSEEREEVLRLRRELREQRDGLARERAELETQLERVRGRTREIAQGHAEATRARLRKVEAQVKELVAALQANPDLKLAGHTLAEVRTLVEEAEVDPAHAEPEAPPPPPPRTLSVGDRVRVRSLGDKIGVVLAEPRKGQVELEVGGLRTRVKLKDLVGLQGQSFERPRAPAPAPAPKAPKGPLDASQIGGVRIPSNTLDLRGKRVDEALGEVERFVDGLVSVGPPVGFILHGHGTGALKQAVREWLPKARQVRAWRAANESEGGDAFTIVGV
ncbi:MAG: Smr/MutS family protein [Alphaproteobacteria bacterium]|nr:Smr/MutS family protein [Alphaproteobacteria bacterium]MCB9794252.1 Smr/MutS family protein [Alphaproteobacteria bacterium]